VSNLQRRISVRVENLRSVLDSRQSSSVDELLLVAKTEIEAEEVSISVQPLSQTPLSFLTPFDFE